MDTVTLGALLIGLTAVVVAIARAARPDLTRRLRGRRSAVIVIGLALLVTLSGQLVGLALRTDRLSLIGDLLGMATVLMGMVLLGGFAIREAPGVRRG